ncbi:hypothetical protein LY90DRAFT_504039 [Neocallimastix californiae]|uniref:Glucosidase 2 subunit beta n=1 Tax=Neocallimastix californiae TaxID=1754190 RepID=A0A1Y2EHG1_9FUNG|nr:hypothetical protein LY90DRAFT_504039 [Neocallimastix californiae]|eukprot:ORY70706.1 hypothetical protein LY90DRAFT_504039 [Neocallimastix californiae]
MKIGGYYIKSNLVYIISVFLAFKLSCAIKVDKLLGVPDEKLKFYKPQEGDVFKCLDGSKVIPYSAVNDDYCDCPDGSDEPGTSACPNTTFYCKNEGYIPSVIPSSRVNDGICDPECCDGSDENSGIIKCPNICEQIAYEQNKEEIEKKRILKDGLAKKEKLLSEASEIVKKENSKKDKLESEIEILNSKLKRLEDIYENGLNHISDLIEDVQNILNEDNSENRLADIIMSLKSIQEEIHSLHNEVEVAQPDDLVEDSDKSNDEDEDNSDDEADAKVENSHFKLDLSVNLDHLKQALELTPCEDGSRNVIFCIGSGIKSLVIGMKNNVVNDSKNLAGWEGWPRLRNPLNLTVKNIMNKIKNLKKSTVQNNNEVDSRDAEFGINFDELKNDYLGVKSLVKSTKNEYDKKEKELKKIKEKTDIDFGPQNVYRTFYNKCYDVEASGYIYTLCLFNDAKQKPKDGNSSTSLGKWSGFDSPTVMKFTNGEKCWNGPQRSAKVILKCSDKNELTSVTEPNKCEYEMIFYTPAACLKMDDDDNKSVKDEL